MAGSVPAAPGVEGYAQLVRAARAAGVRSAVDSRGPDLARAIAQRPDLVKVNADEASELLGTEVQDIGVRAGRRSRRFAAATGGDGRAVDHHARRAGDGVDRTRRRGLARHGERSRQLSRRQRRRVLRRVAPVALSDEAVHGPEAWPQAARLGLGAAAANAEVAGAARLDPARARELAAHAELRPLPTPPVAPEHAASRPLSTPPATTCEIPHGRPISSVGTGWS